MSESLKEFGDSQITKVRTLQKCHETTVDLVNSSLSPGLVFKYLVVSMGLISYLSIR